MIIAYDSEKRPSRQAAGGPVGSQTIRRAFAPVGNLQAEFGNVVLDAAKTAWFYDN